MQRCVLGPWNIHSSADDNKFCRLGNSINNYRMEGSLLKGPFSIGGDWMKPVVTDTITQYRALLTNAEDFYENGSKAEVNATKWYDEKPSLNVVKKKARLEGKDMIIIETMTVTMEIHDSKEE